MIKIILFIFITVLIFTLCCILLCLFFYSITRPYFKYQLEKPNNKLQWRCDFKTFKDIKSFENKENNILWFEPED